MKLQDITNMEKDDVLGMLGLEARRSQSNRLMTTLGTFGIGLLVGAGVGLLLLRSIGEDIAQVRRPPPRGIRRARVRDHPNGGCASVAWGWGLVRLGARGDSCV